jgi:sec-independent protein translocase protein TatA
MPFGLGFGELLLVFAVLLMLFGAKRLPEVASGMGKGIRDFKRAINGLDDQALQASQTPSLQPTQATVPAAVAPVEEAKQIDA